MKDDLFALVEAAAALNAATDGMESLRPQRQAVLDALSNLSRRAEPVADEPVAFEPSEPTKRMAEILGTDFVLNAPDQAQPIDDEALVEQIARALYDDANTPGYIKNNTWECRSEVTRDEYRRKARAILPIIREVRIAADEQVDTTT